MGMATAADGSGSLLMTHRPEGEVTPGDLPDRLARTWIGTAYGATCNCENPPTGRKLGSVRKAWSLPV
jgi:hypothetical protein